MSFTAVGLMIVAMIGAGVAEESGSGHGADPQARHRLAGAGR